MTGRLIAVLMVKALQEILQQKELQALDIGYGYTADGGKTFPFRGKGINLMPTLDEVLNHFPDRSFSYSY